MNCTLTIIGMWEIQKERERNGRWWKERIEDGEEEKGARNEERIDREFNLISFLKRTKRNEASRRGGEKENRVRVRVSEFASVKEQAYEGRKAKSEADLRAVEKSSLSLSLFSSLFFAIIFLLPTSFSTKREAVFLETPRSFLRCLFRAMQVPSFSFFFLSFFFHSFV